MTFIEVLLIDIALFDIEYRISYIEIQIMNTFRMACVGPEISSRCVNMCRYLPGVLYYQAATITSQPTRDSMKQWIHIKSVSEMLVLSLRDSVAYT